MIEGFNTFRVEHPRLFWSSIGTITAVALFAVSFGAARLLNAPRLPVGLNRTWAIVSVVGGSVVTTACLIFIGVLRTKKQDKLREDQLPPPEPQPEPQLLKPRCSFRERELIEPEGDQPYVQGVDFFNRERRVWRPIYCCAALGNTDLVATGSDQGLFAIRDLERAAITQVQHRHAIHQLAVSSDGQCAAILDSQNRILIWRQEQGMHFNPIVEEIENIHSIALSGDGSLLILGQLDATLIHNLRQGSTLTLQHARATEHGGQTGLVACSLDGNTILTVPGVNRCAFWNSSGELLEEAWTGGYAEPKAIALSADGNKALFSNGGGCANVALFDRRTGECKVIAIGGYADVAFAPDQSKIAITGSIALGEAVVAIYTYDGKRTAQCFRFATDEKCHKVFFSGNSIVTLDHGTMRSFDLIV